MRIVLISLFCFVVLILPFTVNAQITWKQLSGGLISAAWSIFAVVVILSFIYAALLFLSSAGEPDKVSRAKRAFIWGVAGVVVGLLAFTIISLIKGIVGAS